MGIRHFQEKVIKQLFTISRSAKNGERKKLPAYLRRDLRLTSLARRARGWTAVG
jgi:hypothetical protein